MADYYKCLDCGHIFKMDNAKVLKKQVGEFLGKPAYEHWDACPECLSTEIEIYSGEDE